MIASHYAALGACRQDGRTELRQKYLALMRELHPDRAGDTPEANSKAADVTVAYATLADHAKRKVYLAELDLTTEQCKKCTGQGRWKKQRGFSVVAWVRCEDCGGCGRVGR